MSSSVTESDAAKGQKTLDELAKHGHERKKRAALLIVLIALAICTIIGGITVFIIGTESQHERYYPLSIVGPAILGLGILLLVLAQAACFVHMIKRKAERRLESSIIEKHMARQQREIRKEREEHQNRLRKANIEYGGSRGFHNESFQTDPDYGSAI